MEIVHLFPCPPLPFHFTQAEDVTGKQAGFQLCVSGTKVHLLLLPTQPKGLSFHKDAFTHIFYLIEGESPTEHEMFCQLSASWKPVRINLFIVFH